jgi:hypothetical protein
MRCKKVRLDLGWRNQEVQGLNREDLDLSVSSDESRIHM